MSMMFFLLHQTYCWSQSAPLLSVGNDGEVDKRIGQFGLPNGVKSLMRRSLIYGLFYIGTSSIFLPMILHALFDLRALWFEYPDRLDRTKQLKEEETSLPL
jgi:membrane protease YdiL (CAAX protease family)